MVVDAGGKLNDRLNPAESGMVGISQTKCFVFLVDDTPGTPIDLVVG
jgi:hypothetical protein